MEKVTLKSVRVYKDKTYNSNHEFFLELTYEVENDKGVYEYIVPKVDLCINKSYFPRLEINSNLYPFHEAKDYIQFDDDVTMPLMKKTITIKDLKGNDVECKNTYYVVRTIKEKTHKMTLSEIEKKLGYKIELVSEKGKEND